MKNNYRLPIVLSALFIAASIPTAGYATNGHQLSAFGAYQQGMGGAVTAAPYDATTAITNPAGMATIGSRTDFSVEMFFPDRRLSFEGGGSTDGGSGTYLVPAVGWTAPVNEKGALFFGGGMYGVSGMGVDYDTVSAPFMSMMLPGWDPGSSMAHLYSQYQFWKMAPTLAWKTEKLAVGLALDMDYQAFGFKNIFTGTAGGGATAVKYGMDLSELQGAYGYGATIGFLYQPAPAFSVGVSYASKQNFTAFKWRLSDGDVDLTAGGGPKSRDGIYAMELDFPQQAALGIAVRPFRRLLWTADVKWINFSDTYDKVALKGNFTGANEVILHFGWDDVWVYATGLQLDVTPNLAIRAGFNYSTSPIDRADPQEIENNLVFPAIVRRHVSGGFTYRFGRNWEMTLAYMKAFKEEMTGESKTRISLEEQAADLEVSYRF